MTLPGPSGVVWALGLLLWGGAAAIVGELVRRIVARWVRLWRSDEPIERFVLDLYLGGALLYLVAALPFGLFVAPVVFALPVAAALGVVVLVGRERTHGGRGTLLSRGLASLARPAPLVALASALVLFGLELAVALPIGTGNTFDAGLLTTYVALLLTHHTIPLSFAPYATPSILYPQGTTVWLGWAQLVFGLPPARTSLLVTPLFFALAPLGAFVFGRRWFASDRGGLATALVVAWLAPATRTIVAGSNDFVFAFPLVLLLAGQATDWVRDRPPTHADALGFGLLAGYAAALNPVGSEWLFVALPLVAALSFPRFGGRALRWGARWATAVATALVAVVPSLYVLVLGHSSPGFVPGAAAAPPGTPTGLTTAQLVGSIDPLLFRPQDVQLSVVPALRLELAILLVLGVGVLIVVGRDTALERYLNGFRRFALSAFVAIVAILATVWVASTGFGPAVVVSALTSGGELSLDLLTLYALVGSVPLALALEWFVGRAAHAPAAREPMPRRRVRRPTGRSDPRRAVVPLALAFVIVVPGVALTPTALPPVLSTLYNDFGNVSASELGMLVWAGDHLPSGARVLVAPGSAADFLPGYAAHVVLLYPLVPGWWWTNASYRLLVQELTNATLDSAGRGALVALDVTFVLVTGNNTRLWPPFSPAPLLADPTAFPLDHQDGNAYLFACTLAPAAP